MRVEANSGRLWTRLLRYKKWGYIMGCTYEKEKGAGAEAGHEAPESGRALERHRWALGAACHLEQVLFLTCFGQGYS